MNPCDYRGTDINYTVLCKRRGWLSVNEIYVINDSEFVKEGKFLSEKNRVIGYKHISIGRISLDNLEIDDGIYIVHEFKRGRKILEADILQTAHYLNCIETALEVKTTGVIHLLSSKKTYTLDLNLELKNKLEKIYYLINSFKSSKIPSPERNYLCFHGCSFRDFCWS